MTVGRGTDVAALGPLPENVRAEGWVPQDAVLARAAAVVGHGGYGTTLGALAHGVPLAVLPLFSSDQWHNAERVAGLGAGIALPGAPRGAVEPPGPDVLAALPGRGRCAARRRRVRARRAGDRRGDRRAAAGGRSAAVLAGPRRRERPRRRTAALKEGRSARRPRGAFVSHSESNATRNAAAAGTASFNARRSPAR